MGGNRQQAGMQSLKFQTDDVRLAGRDPDSEINRNARAPEARTVAKSQPNLVLFDDHARIIDSLPREGLVPTELA